MEKADTRERGSGIMFVLYFDEKYFEWAPVLIESIIISEPEEKICVYGIELAGSQVEKLLSYSCVSCVSSTLQETAFTYRKKHADRQAARIIQRIASFFLESFYRFPEEKLYMILDVDSLVVNPLTEIKQEMLDYDIGISLGGEQVRTGFVLVNPTGTSRKLVEDWNNLLMEGPCHWSKGQITLFQLYQERKNEVRFLEFNGSYRDPLSKNESHIWSAYKTRFGSKIERFELYKKKLEKLKGGER